MNSLIAWKPIYSTVCARFGLLHRLMNLDSSEIREFANALIEAYPDDLDRFDFADELIQFAKFARKHICARDEKSGTSVELYRDVHCRFCSGHL